MQDQAAWRDERSAQHRDHFVAMAEFEYLVRDLRPLLTDAEREELDALERRLQRARGHELGWSVVQAEIQAFVRKILASST